MRNAVTSGYPYIPFGYLDAWGASVVGSYFGFANGITLHALVGHDIDPTTTVHARTTSVVEFTKCYLSNPTDEAAVLDLFKFYLIKTDVFIYPKAIIINRMDEHWRV